MQPDHDANGVESGVGIAQGLTGTELTFFTVAHVVLCFVFVAKPVLVTHQCFRYC